MVGVDRSMKALSMHIENPYWGGGGGGGGGGEYNYRTKQLQSNVATVKKSLK